MSLDDFQRLTMAQSDLPNIVRLTRGIASSEVTVFKKIGPLVRYLLLGLIMLSVKLCIVTLSN